MKIPEGKVRKIGIFRALQLGDMLCAVPAIRALRKAFPAAEIILIGLPWAESFVSRFSNYLDRFIHFPGYEGLPEQPFDKEEYLSFLSAIQQENLDLLIQMQGNGNIVNAMMADWGATHLAGYYNEESVVDSPLFMPYPDYGLEKERHIQLMEFLGISVSGHDLEFPILPADEKEYNQLLLPLIEDAYVVVHPGSRGYWRQWPPKFFAAMADEAAAQGYTVVVTGTANERDITTELIKCMHHQCIDLTGKTSLGAMALLIKKAHALIANCTGVSHMADALKTPSLIISMDGEPHRWSPANQELHHVIDWTKEPSFEEVFRRALFLVSKS